MSKSISPMLSLKSGTKLIPASPRSYRSDEFAAGYSSAVCSPAWPASASPDGLHLPATESYLSIRFPRKISKLDSKARTRQTINIRVGPNQSIEVGPDRNIKLNLAFSRKSDPQTPTPWRIPSATGRDLDSRRGPVNTLTCLVPLQEEYDASYQSRLTPKCLLM
jgi:hypothetical protein